MENSHLTTQHSNINFERMELDKHKILTNKPTSLIQTDKKKIH